MNLKIKNQNLCFKITEDELTHLREGRPLNASISFLGGNFVATINPQESGKTMQTKLVLDQNDVYLTLLLSPEKIEKLAALGRNRDGLQEKLDGVLVILQVDFRKK